MLGLYEVFQSERINGFIVRPAEDFVEELDLAVSVDLGHQIPPFLPLTGNRIDNKVQRVYCLGNVISRKCKSAFLYGVYPAAVSRRNFLAAFGTDKTLLTEHLQKMLLGIGNVLVTAVRTFDYPLGL